MKRMTYKIEGSEYWYNQYTAEETRDDIWPLCERIFDCAAVDVDLPQWTGGFFKDPDWPVVLLVGDLRISSHRDAVPLEQWEYPLEEYVYDRDELEPLWQMLREDGVEEVLMCSAHKIMNRPNPHGDSAGIPPDRNYVTPPFVTVDGIGAMSHFAFDRGCRWGFIGTIEQEGVLGGEPDFMERFIAKAGGLEELQRRFRIDVLNRYEDHHKGLPLWRPVYERIGWPYPFEGEEAAWKAQQEEASAAAEAKAAEGGPLNRLWRRIAGG